MSATGSSSERGDTEDPEEPGDPAAVRQAGVLGNLPKSRPSVRSPRRTEPKPVRKPAPEVVEEPEADQAARSSTEPESVSERSSSSTGAAEIEALARGGIAIAGEAASLGLRIAGRAAAAVRDAVERR